MRQLSLSAAWFMWTAGVSALTAVLAAPAAHAQPAGAPAEGFAELVERLSPAVVSIRTRQRVERPLPLFPPGSPAERFNRYFQGPQRAESHKGSGFVIDASGVIVTNNHVIESADHIEVAFADGETLDARIIGRDPSTDLAVLRVEPPEPLPAVSFGDSASARAGDWVVAIGNPFGLSHSVSVGVVSANNRDISVGRYDNFIQTDAAINQGNSGGPLFNLGGDVIGVNTVIFSPTGGSVGVGFAIPSEMAGSIIDQLVAFGETRRGWLGVRVQDATQEIAESYGLDRAVGVVVTEVEDEGPAEAFGVEVGDLITHYAGDEVADERGLTQSVTDTEPGTRIVVELVRAGAPMSIEVEIGRLQEDLVEDEDAEDGGSDTLGAVATAIGVTFAPLTDAARAEHRIPADVEGVLVDAIAAGSDAQGKIAVGDVIEEIGFEAVATPQQAADRVSIEVEEGRPVLLVINRGGDIVFQSVRAMAER